MSLSNTPARWGLIAQCFHWAMFALIIATWFAIETREDFPKDSPERLQWMLLHKSLGLSVFVLVWLRIGARLSQVTPQAIGSALQQKVSALVGLGLYALMIGLPIGGLLASQFYGKPVAFFGLFELPMLVGENKEMGDLMKEAHEAGFGALLFLLALHVGGALVHHFRLKDDVLRRMLPWG